MKTVDCACVIHGDYYSWEYVERLYNMLSKNSRYKINLHVYTESLRVVPDYLIKHSLKEFAGVSGPKKSWWHKLQLFNSELFSGNLLYLDLDTVIVNNIDWIWDLEPGYFYTIKDFKYLHKPSWQGINSSIMYWNTNEYHWVWESFVSSSVSKTVRQYRGDQDFLDYLLIPTNKLQYFKASSAVSWRWQAFDGGYDLKQRVYNTPGTGTKVDEENIFLICHGLPKPHQIKDKVLQSYWKV